MNIGLDLIREEFDKIIHYMAVNGWNDEDEKLVIAALKLIFEKIKSRNKKS